MMLPHAPLNCGCQLPVGKLPVEFEYCDAVSTRLPYGPEVTLTLWWNWKTTLQLSIASSNTLK